MLDRTLEGGLRIFDDPALETMEPSMSDRAADEPVDRPDLRTPPHR